LQEDDSSEWSHTSVKNNGESVLFKQSLSHRSQSSPISGYLHRHSKVADDHHPLNRSQSADTYATTNQSSFMSSINSSRENFNIAPSMKGYRNNTHSVGILHKRTGSGTLAEQQASRVKEHWDVFSFGMVLWVLIRQRRPWSNASDREVMYRVCRGERPCLNRADIASPVLSKLNSVEGNNEAVDPARLLAVQTPRTSAGLRWMLLSKLSRECWQQKPHKRPSIHSVSRALEKSISELKKNVLEGVHPETESREHWNRFHRSIRITD
jgi:hypothetical protein